MSQAMHLRLCDCTDGFPRLAANFPKHRARTAIIARNSRGGTSHDHNPRSQSLSNDLGWSMVEGTCRTWVLTSTCGRAWIKASNVPPSASCSNRETRLCQALVF
jgi:hypothetical protein